MCHTFLCADDRSIGSSCRIGLWYQLPVVVSSDSGSFTHLLILKTNLISLWSLEKWLPRIGGIVMIRPNWNSWNNMGICQSASSTYAWSRTFIYARIVREVVTIPVNTIRVLGNGKAALSPLATTTAPAPCILWSYASATTTHHQQQYGEEMRSEPF